jgi:predicted ATP-grasp superfamily ATP-dependent carboligase
MDCSVPVVVVGLADTAALGVARSLGRLGVEVHGVHDSMTAPARSRYFRQVHIVRPQDMVVFLGGLADRLGPGPVLIPAGPVLDDEALAELRPLLRFPEAEPGAAGKLAAAASSASASDDAPPAEAVWSVGAYYDGQGERRFGVTARNLRQFPPAGGSTSVAVCLANPALLQLADEAVAAAGYRGPVDLEFHFDPAQRAYRLAAAVPGVSPRLRLFVGTGGMDVVRALYQEMTGQLILRSRAVPGRTWLCETDDVRAFLDLRARGRLQAWPWARSLFEVDETAWWAVDDVRPFGAALVGEAVARRRSEFSRPVAAGAAAG